MKSTFLFLSVLTLSFFGCKSQQYSLEELTEKRLVFGNGGGMTGASDTYVLLENGQLFHTNSLTKQSSELESISRIKAKEYFTKLKELSLSERDFDHPGNMYYFLEDVNSDEGHRVTWGSNDHEISEECKTFYKELRTTIK